MCIYILLLKLHEHVNMYNVYFSMHCSAHCYSPTLSMCLWSGGAVPRAADAVFRLPETASPVQSAGLGHQVPH